MRKVFGSKSIKSSIFAISAILASTTLLNANAYAFARPPMEERDAVIKHGDTNNQTGTVNLSRDENRQQQRQEYRQPQRNETPRTETPRHTEQDLSRINQMQYGRPNPFPNQNNYQRPPQRQEGPTSIERNDRRDARNDDRRNDHNNDRRDDRRDDNRRDDRRNDDRHDSRRDNDNRHQNNWNNGWNWGSNNNNHNDYRRDDNRNNNYSWNRYDNNSRKHFEFGRREGNNFWGPNGNNWSRWNNSWGDPNYYARRWGFDSYDQYRGWRRGNVWYSHPSLWNDWGGWYSFFLSDGIWGFSYSNYGDPYYNSYGNQCLKMQSSDWQYGKRAIYSFVACLNRWGQYEEVRGTRNFEGWDY